MTDVITENLAIEIEAYGRKYLASPGAPIDISIPLRFSGPQPNAYGVQEAVSQAVVAGDMIGDTRRGGSCNFEQYTFIPHCSGTHTESVGHITHERISVRDCLTDVMIPATLVTVEPADAAETQDTYPVAFQSGDRLITRASLDGSLEKFGDHSGALIVRTLPNDDSKLTRVYLDDVPPYFSTEAMDLIVRSGVKHLLVDVPSIDRMYDEGKLSNHRLFWNVRPDSFEAGDDARRGSTITELIYVPERVADGDYLLNLQIAPFAADASPSRPLLLKPQP